MATNTYDDAFAEGERVRFSSEIGNILGTVRVLLRDGVHDNGSPYAIVDGDDGHEYEVNYTELSRHIKPPSGIEVPEWTDDDSVYICGGLTLAVCPGDPVATLARAAPGCCDITAADCERAAIIFAQAAARLRTAE